MDISEEMMNAKCSEFVEKYKKTSLFSILIFFVRQLFKNDYEVFNFNIGKSITTSTKDEG